MLPNPRQNFVEGVSPSPAAWGPYLDPLYYGDPLSYPWIRMGGFGTSSEIRLERERRLVIMTPSGSGQRGIYTPLPSASHYIVTLGIVVNNNRNASSAQGGVLLTDGTKLVTMHQLSTGVMEGAKWNAYNSFSALYWNSGWRSSPLIWYRWVDDGTSRIYYMSYDGITFVQMYSVARADFLTPIGVGIFYDPNTGGHPGAVSLFDFRIEPFGRDLTIF